MLGKKRGSRSLPHQPSFLSQRCPENLPEDVLEMDVDVEEEESEELSFLDYGFYVDPATGRWYDTADGEPILDEAEWEWTMVNLSPFPVLRRVPTDLKT